MSLCFYLLSSIQQRGRDTQPRSCSFLTIHPIRGVSDLSMVNNPTKTILNWPNLWTNQLLQPQKIILQGPDLIQGSHLGPLWPAELFLIQLWNVPPLNHCGLIRGIQQWAWNGIPHRFTYLAVEPPPWTYTYLRRNCHRTQRLLPLHSPKPSTCPRPLLRQSTWLLCMTAPRRRPDPPADEQKDLAGRCCLAQEDLSAYKRALTTIGRAWRTVVARPPAASTLPGHRPAGSAAQHRLTADQEKPIMCPPAAEQGQNRTRYKKIFSFL
jgi:hypothetical protein